MLDFAGGWGARQWLGLLVQLALFAGILGLIVKLSEPPSAGDGDAS